MCASGPIQNWMACGSGSEGRFSTGTMPRKALVPEYTASSAPVTNRRTVERTPSAPTTRSARSTRPLANSSTTESRSWTMLTSRQPRCRCSALNAPLSVFCRSARWIPKYGAPNRFSYQLSSLTG